MIVFLTTLFFTLLYLMYGWLGFGFITSACWWIFGIVWLVINPMSTDYAMGLLFQMIGFVFFLMSLYQTLQSLRLRKLKGMEEDDIT